MLNLDKQGRPLCKVSGGKFKDKIISVEPNKDNDQVLKTFNKLVLEDGKFQQIPNPDTERQIGFITGPSGSGKSTYIANYVKSCKKYNKNMKVYLFSSLDSDDSLDIIEPLRVRIDDTLITDPIKMEDFEEGSMIIFDDCDCLTNKKHRQAVYDISNQVLQIGRHYRLSACFVSHLPTQGKDTRMILNECHFVVYFPHSGSARQTNYLLTEYLGLDKKDITEIKKSGSRWACIYKNFPQIYMTDKIIKVLSSED